jgi:hypothetical protein
MKHFIVVTLVALITLTIVFAIYRPDLLEVAWLWVVGLAGPAIAFVRAIMRKIQNFFRSFDHSENKTRS